MATAISIPGYVFFTAPSDAGGTLRLLARRVAGAVIIYKVSKNAPGAIIDAFDPAALGGEVRTPDTIRTPVRHRALTALDAPPEAPKAAKPPKKRKADVWSIILVRPDAKLVGEDADVRLFESEVEAARAERDAVDDARARGMDAYRVHGTQTIGAKLGTVAENKGKVRRPADCLYQAPEQAAEPQPEPVADAGTDVDVETVDLLGEDAA